MSGVTAACLGNSGDINELARPCPVSPMEPDLDVVVDYFGRGG